MKLSDLIIAVGDENVRVQTIHESFVNGSVGKHSGKITFEASKDFTQQLLNAVATGHLPRYTALVVWIPGDLIKEAEEKMKTLTPH